MYFSMASSTEQKTRLNDPIAPFLLHFSMILSFFVFLLTKTVFNILELIEVFKSDFFTTYVPLSLRVWFLGYWKMWKMALHPHRVCPPGYKANSRHGFFVIPVQTLQSASSDDQFGILPGTACKPAKCGGCTHYTNTMRIPFCSLFTSVHWKRHAGFRLQPGEKYY